MIDIFDAFYHGKRVLVTGHTGFEGSWLSIWLHELGAEVIGVAQGSFSQRDNFVLSGIGGKIKADIRADIRDGERMMDIFREYWTSVAKTFTSGILSFTNNSALNDVCMVMLMRLDSQKIPLLKAAFETVSWQHSSIILNGQTISLQELFGYSTQTKPAEGWLGHIEL